MSNSERISCQNDPKKLPLKLTFILALWQILINVTGFVYIYLALVFE